MGDSTSGLGTKAGTTKYMRLMTGVKCLKVQVGTVFLEFQQMHDFQKTKNIFDMFCLIYHKICFIRLFVRGSLSNLFQNVNLSSMTNGGISEDKLFTFAENTF